MVLPKVSGLVWAWTVWVISPDSVTLRKVNFCPDEPVETTSDSPSHAMQ